MIHVGWLAPSADCWDSNMLRLLLDGKIYPHGLKVEHHVGFPTIGTGCVLVVPGQYWHLATDQINDEIQRFEWVLLVRTADEEDLFDISLVEHSNAKWWVQTPRWGRHYGDEKFFGVGFPPHFNDLPKDPPGKDLDVFLAAQNTHARRRECFQALDTADCFKRFVVASEGFTQGISKADYVRAMCEARVAPAPAGAVSVDSFRAWEALESHAVPILDGVSPVDGPTDYWARVLGNHPVPVVTEYTDLPGYDWPAHANRITAWWMRYKRALARGLRDDLEALGAL